MSAASASSGTAAKVRGRRETQREETREDKERENRERRREGVERDREKERERRERGDGEREREKERGERQREREEREREERERERERGAFLPHNGLRCVWHFPKRLWWSRVTLHIHNQTKHPSSTATPGQGCGRSRVTESTQQQRTSSLLGARHCTSPVEPT